MKIYTKKGDQGQTSLFGGGSYSKDDGRIEAYGTVDELNSVVGCASAELGTEQDLKDLLLKVQGQLFMLGAELATVQPTAEMKRGFLQKAHAQALEAQIDEWEKSLPPLKQFILPGGSRAASFLHLARTVCRRAERRLVSLSKNVELRPELLVYMNRLSDWIFVLSREVNRRAKISDVLWEGILR